MRLDGVVLLAAHTARSQAYLQALVAQDLYPEKVIILGEVPPQETVKANAHDSWQGIPLPDLTERLASTCQRADIAIVQCAAKDVNVEEIFLAIKQAAPRIVIYSGLGGQIVANHILALGADFLHMHSGWLPEYRGSTTLYYALLNDESPGVTALILDRTIDTGPVVARRRYVRPPPSLDIDRVYDAAIRADLLVRTMQTYADTGSLPVLERQRPGYGTNYYVIHPVLKHLAILSLDRDEQS